LQSQNSDTGLLRIDSSKDDGPHVSFIYYGQMENISSGEEFQQLLDEFVDDALDFFDRLNNGGEEEFEELMPQSGSSLHAHERQASERSNSANAGTHNMTGSNKSLKSNSTGTTASATVSSQSSDEGGYGTHNVPVPSKGNSFHRRTSPPQHSNTPPPAAELGSSSASLNNSTHEKSGKKSVFSKVMSTLQKKNDPTVAMAFIDPSNPTSAFVVDKTVADEPVKPKLVISRKKGGSFHAPDGRDRETPSRHASTFHVDDTPRHSSSRKEKSKSFHDNRPDHRAKRTSMPDIQEEFRSRTSYSSKRSSQLSADDDSDRKCISFYETKRPSMCDNARRKATSFHNAGKNRRVSINPEEEAHHVDKRMSHNASFNRSVDIFNDSGPCEAGHNASAGFNYSEPVLPSQNKMKKVRSKQVIVQQESTHSSSSKVSHQSASSRRKTVSDVERPKVERHHRRGAYPTESSKMKAYYQGSNAHPPPPPPRSRGGRSKWCMENVNDSESEDGSIRGDDLYDD
jgi:hypothetical protein